ncbi:MAG: hypothetical protein D6696_20130 [Acidobacteria bacterium]|nr:MAG: hypothetical protein D6696_20130 [Acidobacteriota bacterium]
MERPEPQPSPPAPLVPPAQPPAAAPRGGRWAVVLGLLALVVVVAAVVAVRRDDLLGAGPELALAPGGRLAVLPLVNATGEGGQAWVEWGLAEIVNRVLSATPGLEVLRHEVLERQVEERALAGASERSHLRTLAFHLGASRLLDATVRSSRRGYVIDFSLADRHGELAAASVTGPQIVPLAEQLADAVARALAPDALPVDFARTLSGDPFLDRLYGMGLAVLHDGDVAAAETYFELALRHQPGFLLARAALARCARLRGDLESSRQRWLEVLAQAQGRGDRRLQAESLEGLGLLSALSGRYAEADELYQQAWSIYLSLEDGSGQLAILEQRARVALSDGQDERAEGLFADMLERQRAAGDLLGQIDVLRQLGTLHLRRRALDSAESLFAESRQLARQVGDLPAEMNALASLGEVARLAGDLELAETRWAEALTFYRQRRDRQRLLLLSARRAEAAAARGDLDAAEELYLDVVELAAELDEPASEARASLELARILLRKGYPYQARPHLERALELDAYLDDPLAVQRVIARLAYERDDFRLAADTLRAVKKRVGEAWTAEDEALLAAYERSLAAGRRQPLPASAVEPES